MKKIEKNKPLPCHTKLDYDECYAKVILETFFPELFHNLEIKDKPDLIDTQHKIGIEVTNATSKKEREILSLSSRITYGSSCNRKRDIQRIEKLGGRYTDYGVSLPESSYSIEKIYQSLISIFSTKVKKLNRSGYLDLSDYRLYIYFEIFYIRDYIENLVYEFQKANVMQKKYSTIYLFTLDYICIIDLFSGQVRETDLKNRHWGLSERARQLVEEGESNE